MKPKYITVMFVLLLCSVLVFACSPQGQDRQNEVEPSEMGKAFERWEELSQQNEKFFNQDGWLIIDNEVLRSPDARQGYAKKTEYYQIENGKVIQALTKVSDSEDGTELQRFVVNPEGIRADLIELRAEGLNAQEYAHPAKFDLTFWKISPTNQDLEIVRNLRENIKVIEVEEQLIENRPVLVFTIEYGSGTTGGKGALFSENSGYIGKIEKYIYDLGSGNRIEKQDRFIKEGGDLTQMSTVKLKVSQVSDLTSELKEEIDLAKRELDFYIELFDID
jgi:hypothetical protein